jgi:hypothetical protein
MPKEDVSASGCWHYDVYFVEQSLTVQEYWDIGRREWPVCTLSVLLHPISGAAASCVRDVLHRKSGGLWRSELAAAGEAAVCSDIPTKVASRNSRLVNTRTEKQMSSAADVCCQVDSVLQNSWKLHERPDIAQLTSESVKTSRSWTTRAARRKVMQLMSSLRWAPQYISVYRFCCRRFDAIKLAISSVLADRHMNGADVPMTVS